MRRRISRDRGLTTPCSATPDVQTRVLVPSRHGVFVGVNTTFGVDSFSRFAEMSDHTVVTDRRRGRRATWRTRSPSPNSRAWPRPQGRDFR